jgi:hypothetical protein
MSADVTGEPHFRAEVYRVHNIFLHIGHQHSFEKNGKLAI